MAGLGDYIKGKKFTLKSGNNPAFKMIGDTEAGDSPITKDFGIGKGTSPYRNTDVKGGDDGKKGGGWKKAAKIAVAGLTSGLDAVYGSGKTIPLASDRLKNDDVAAEDDTLSQAWAKKYGYTKTKS